MFNAEPCFCWTGINGQDSCHRSLSLSLSLSSVYGQNSLTVSDVNGNELAQITEWSTQKSSKNHSEIVGELMVQPLEVLGQALLGLLAIAEEWPRWKTRSG